MTGRLYCDGWALASVWMRQRDDVKVTKTAYPVAWPFLSGQERRAWSHAAARVPKPKRAR